jgi:hypothetical protein
MSPAVIARPPGIWEKYLMAMDDVTRRLERISKAFTDNGIPFALVGGQAVALWVASKDPSAVRTTKDVDILLRRNDLARARAAALSVDLDYFETMGVGMFLERTNPNPRHGVHLLWAGEKVRPEDPIESPAVADSVELETGKPVVALNSLVAMKLMVNRDQDRVHLRDLIGVNLVSRDMLSGLPAELANLLEALLVEEGR